MNKECKECAFYFKGHEEEPCFSCSESPFKKKFQKMKSASHPISLTIQYHLSLHKIYQIQKKATDSEFRIAEISAQSEKNKKYLIEAILSGIEEKAISIVEEGPDGELYRV